MEDQDVPDEIRWLGVIGRATAFLALKAASLEDEELLVRAEFLGNLGLSRREAARVLGTTDDSLRVLQGRAAKAKKLKSKSKKRT